MAAPTTPPGDVPARHWAKKSVDKVTSTGLMSTQNGKFQGDKPVTRYELAVTLDRLVKYIEAGRAPLHPTARPKPFPAPKGASAEEGKAITHLVNEGFLPSDSPIVTGDGHAVVTAKQLSAAIAQVTIRLSDRSVPPQKD
jgi:hypothetical protein